MNDSIINLQPNAIGSPQDKQSESSLAMTEEEINLNDSVSNSSNSRKEQIRHDFNNNQLGKNKKPDTMSKVKERPIGYA